MADLNDLDFISISDMSNDEALEMLRQIRLNRRVPKTIRTTTVKKAKAAPALSDDQATELLRLLTGEK